MATELSRAQLTQEFRDGERPTGDDFASAWLSFLNKTDDGLKIDANGNLEVSRGLTLKDSSAGVAGTLRFNGGEVQFHDGSGFKSLSTSSGAFTPVAGGPSVAFNGGNVGIGNFAVAPTNRLEIPLNANTGAGERVRFGNVVAHNGPSNAAGAYISHNNVAGAATSFALFQDSQGNTSVNAANNTVLTLSQNGVARIRVLTSGNIELLPTTSVSIAGNTAIGSPSAHSDLSVFGNAAKLVAGPFNAIASDERVKKDVRPFNDGLGKIVALKPMKYKFNGKGGTPDDGNDYVGFMAQDVQKVFPELILKRKAKLEESDATETDILTYDFSPITFAAINAIKDLYERIKLLENNGDQK